MGYVVKLLDFQEFQDFLSFTNASLREQQIGKGTIGSGDGLGVGGLEVAGEGAIVLTNRFADVDGLFIENDRQIWLLLLFQGITNIVKRDSLTVSVFDFTGNG